MVAVSWHKDDHDLGLGEAADHASNACKKKQKNTKAQIGLRDETN